MFTKREIYGLNNSVNWNIINKMFKKMNYKGENWVPEMTVKILQNQGNWEKNPTSFFMFYSSYI